MKKLHLLLLLIMCLPILGRGQYAYIPEFIGTTNLKYTDLTDPSNYTVVGSTVANLGAMDFGPDNVLYGISDNDNGLYSIDTTNGSPTFIATVTPPGSAFWSGMALDPTDGTMYICSTDGNVNSFYTIDLSTGATTLIGTNSYESGVVGIAFDDSGQMYAIYLIRKFYSINKNDATGTLIGNLTSSPSAGQWHGLDFCSQNQTMYMTAYNSFTFDNELYTIDLATAANTLVGSVVQWTGSIACAPVAMNANFIADNVNVCEGGVVNFTDQSSGNPVSWAWTFEGGTPGTSSDENPSVTYNTAGTYDVQLIVSDGSSYDTLLMENYITVNAVPDQADMPSGPTETCQGGTYTYTTNAVADATAYEWSVDPSTAGTISGTGTSGTFEAALSWNGSYTVKVRATNDCGQGTWSADLACDLYHSPEQFDLTGGGSYCEGGEGLELILSGSETGVDYELFLDDVSTGTILPGTGSSLSFGYQTEQGFYTVTATNASCTQQMIGENYIFIQPLPGQPGTPAGLETVCSGDVTDYTTTEASDATSYTWVLSPEEAGTMTPGDLSVEIEWAPDFSGTAILSVLASNDCGDGPVSDGLNITLNMTPSPEISGSSLVCSGYTEDYMTEDHAGSTYTWEVTGGTIVNGSGTNQVSVEWGDPGAGSLVVTEESAEGCSGTAVQFDVTIQECTSIGEIQGNEINIYPSPVNYNLHLKAGNASLQGAIISIYSSSGKLINEKTIIEGDRDTYIWDVSNLKPGLYILKIRNANGMLRIGKFIKN